MPLRSGIPGHPAPAENRTAVQAKIMYDELP